MNWTRITGIVIPGHGVASGKGGDPRYPNGTISQQISLFQERGLDLSPYYPGTINLDIRPWRYIIAEPSYFFEGVDWSEFIDPENFFFFKCKAQYQEQSFNGYIYLPDPATKSDHFQPNDMLELILPEIHGVQYGDHFQIDVPDSAMNFVR